ncbi:MAG TPA: thioredoxin domain-containing protein [Patescibacteria group bacterium]|nr:thioredoxin domain-containing protein [Patescibacteria group bacterium]
MASHKGLNLILIAVLTVTAVIFGFQIKKTIGITTRPKTIPLISNDLYFLAVTSDDPVYGNPGATHLIVEYVDFNCEKCLELHQKISALVDKHPDKLQLIWKDLPKTNLFSSRNIEEHKAAYCAKLQKKFWPFANQIIEARLKKEKPNLSELAGQNKLNLPAFEACLLAESTAEHLKNSIAVAQAEKIVSTPAIFVNYKRINLLEDIQIDELLQEVIKE